MNNSIHCIGFLIHEFFTTTISLSLFLYVSMYAHEFFRLQAYFPQKLCRIVCNNTTNNCSRPVVVFVAFRSTKQEFDDFLSFLWVLVYKFFKRRGSTPIFLRKLYKIVCNTVVDNFSRPDLIFAAFRNMKQKFDDFLKFPWMLAHDFFRHRNSRHIFWQKLYEIIRNDDANNFNRSDAIFTTFKSILGNIYIHYTFQMIITSHGWHKCRFWYRKFPIYDTMTCWHPKLSAFMYTIIPNFIY